MAFHQEETDGVGGLHRWKWDRERQERRESGSWRVVGRERTGRSKVRRLSCTRRRLTSRNLSERVPGELQTNNRGELLVRLIFLQSHLTPGPSGHRTPYRWNPGVLLLTLVGHTRAGNVPIPSPTYRNPDRLAIHHIMYDDIPPKLVAERVPDGVKE